MDPSSPYNGRPPTPRGNSAGMAVPTRLRNANSRHGLENTDVPRLSSTGTSHRIRKRKDTAHHLPDMNGLQSPTSFGTPFTTPTRVEAPREPHLQSPYSVSDQPDLHALRRTLSKLPSTVYTDPQILAPGPFGSPTINFSSPHQEAPGSMHDTIDLADPSSSDDGFPDVSRTQGLMLEERQFPGLFTSRMQSMGIHPPNSTGIPSGSSMSISPTTPSRLSQRPTYPKLDPKLRSLGGVARLEEFDMSSTTFFSQQSGPAASRENAALTQKDSSTRQETAHPKATKAATTRKVISGSSGPKITVPKVRKPASVKPKSGNPGTAKPKLAQPYVQPDVAQPISLGTKTSKRRSSVSHPKTPKSKMLKTETPALDPVMNTPVHASTPPLNQVPTPVRIAAVSNGGFTERGMGYLDQATPAISNPRQQQRSQLPASSPAPSVRLASLSLDRSTPVQASAVSQSIVPEAVTSPAPQSIVPEPDGTTGELIVPEPIGTSTQLILSDVSGQKGQGIQQAPAQPDAFPSFRDGDVMIISPTGKTWKLHSAILINASPVIKTILSKRDLVSINKKLREEGNTIRWKLIMVDEPDAEWTDPDGLKFKTFQPVVSQTFLLSIWGECSSLYVLMSVACLRQAQLHFLDASQYQRTRC